MTTTLPSFRVIFSLASILAIRMLGLFMILPVLTLYANHLQGATPTLMGVALGIYGFTQACLQIPFGMLSDKIGRKTVIAAGLILFVIGSIVAASSTHIHGIIVGRALQGAGAIGSALSAFLADLVPSEHRLKAMASLGMTIGTSFILAMILGPFLNAWIGLSGLFWLTAFLGVCALLILFLAVPTARSIAHVMEEPTTHSIFTLLRHQNLLALNFTIFVLHGVLTAMFMALPLILKSLFGPDTTHQSLLYLLVLLLSFLLMVPGIIFAEKRKRAPEVVSYALFALIASEILLLALQSSLTGLAITLLLFFTAFNLMEAALPSLVAKVAPAKNRGTAMGIFSSWQFLGIFCGGAGGGLLLQHYGIDAVFIGCTILAAIGWLVWVGFFAKI